MAAAAVVGLNKGQIKTVIELIKGARSDSELADRVGLIWNHMPERARFDYRQGTDQYNKSGYRLQTGDGRVSPFWAFAKTLRETILEVS